MLRKNKFRILKNNWRQGFTLIEILVALLLVTLILTMVSTGPSSNRDNLDDIINGIERAVRFSVDEAALKNAVMRVRFKLEDTPQKYSVEFGPSGDFTISASFNTPVKDAKTSDEKREAKAKKKRDNEFNRVREFSDGAKEIHENVRIIGFGSSLFKGFVTEADGALYIYPSGEKDAAIVILGTEDEIATIEINPFTLDIKVKYFKHEEEIDFEELIEKQDELAISYYKTWLNKK